jgi:hypothetical protein
LLQEALRTKRGLQRRLYYRRRGISRDDVEVA